MSGVAGERAANVGIVIVSHSPLVARGAADMVRQMVGDGVPLAWTGGNAEGGGEYAQRPARPQREPQQQAPAASRPAPQQAPAQPAPDYDSFDDDIPF